MSRFSRRGFLQTAGVAGAGLVLSFYVPGKARAATPPPPKDKPLPPPNAFVRVGTDDSVTVVLAHSEMGQGIWTGLAMCIAEELDCDWSKIRCEHAGASQTYAHPLFGMQATGGSSSQHAEFDRYRNVGAMAREMLVRAAGKQWKVKPAKLHTENGFVINGKKKLSYGELSNAAMQLEPPKTIRLKAAKDWKIIGKPTRRLDTPEKITGKATFGMDIHFEGLRTALVARAPAFGGKVKSFDAAKAKSIPGVEQVVQIPSGVAVVATNFWAAKQGRDALEIEWDLGPGAEADSEALKASFRALAKTPGTKAAKEGDAGAALAKASKKIEVEYDVPYLAHATMEPLNCTIKVDSGAAEVWTGTQFQQIEQGTVAQILGLPPEKVTIHTPFLGGGFGRRGSLRSDFVSEAAFIVKAAGVPVKTVWTREDDIRGGYYRPAFLHRVEAGLDEKGVPIAWRHTIVGQSIMTGTIFEPMMVKNGIDPTSVEGVSDSPYLEGVADRFVSLHTPKNPTPVHFWRSVGHTHTCFAMESAIDELAHLAGQEPLAFRLAMLKDKPRIKKVLQTAADKAGWGTALPEGHARGIALQESFGSIVAEVAEVSVDKNKRIRVHKVCAAVDCGTAVNPLAVEAQVQGAIAYGLSAALYSEVTLKGGRVQQSNFHDYRVLRINEMPEVQVHLIASGEKMGGIGEPATPPITAAVANAVFALTQQRLRSLPLRLA